jgi:hypothetical protein
VNSRYDGVVVAFTDDVSDDFIADFCALTVRGKTHGASLVRGGSSPADVQPWT